MNTFQSSVNDMIILLYYLYIITVSFLLEKIPFRSNKKVREVPLDVLLHNYKIYTHFSVYSIKMTCFYHRFYFFFLIKFFASSTKAPFSYIYFFSSFPDRLILGTHKKTLEENLLRFLSNYFKLFFATVANSAKAFSS